MAARWPWQLTSSARLRDVVVVAAFVLAVVITVVQPWCGRDRLRAADVATIVSQHLSLIETGDLVLVHPPWRDDIVDAVRPLLPPRQQVSEAFTRGHTDGWPALVVVAEGVQPWPASIEARRIEVGATVIEDGGVRFFRLPAAAAKTTTTTAVPAKSTAAAAVRGSLLDLSSARVSVVDDKGLTRSCLWSAQRARHLCAGLPEWMHVGDEDLVIAGRRQRCTWAHPITGGRVVIEHADIDSSAGLRLRAALSDAAADNADGAAVTFTLDVGGAHRALTVQHARGFAEREIEPTARGPLTLTVTTPNDGQRHVCFQLVRR